MCVLRFSLCGTIKTGKQKGEQKEDLLYNCLYADSPIELNYFFCYFKITRHDSVFCNDTQTSAAATTNLNHESGERLSPFTKLQVTKYRPLFEIRIIYF